jgi:trehalose 6-phosphate synthase
MLALLDPSRQTIPEYVDYRAAIEHEAAAVEARHPGSLHLRLEDDFAGSVAAYKQFDVLLVNSVADGLNLVSKEAPLVNLRDGVVVLSENAGAYEELQDWVLPVDPLDLEGHVSALERALELTADERRERASAIRSHVRAHDLGAWAEAELGELDLVSRIRA